MKLRLSKDEVRLRLMPTGLREFMKNGQIAESVEFDPAANVRLVFALERTDRGGDVAVSFENERLTVAVPAAKADRWTTTDEVGIDVRIPRGGAENLRALIEKDLGCDHSAPDSDNERTSSSPTHRSEDRES